MPEATLETAPASDRAVRTALLSVSDKTGLIPFAEALHAAGVSLLSTGGTATALRDAGLEVTDVADVTGFPEIMDGRVKTLHPRIHGGLLARRDIAEHEAARDTHQIPAIDCLVVNLYPFEETLASGADRDTVVENIDIGGPAMIRAAAKNHAFLTVVTDPADYDNVARAIAAGGVDTPTRRRLAQKAFARTAAYDAAISSWLAEDAGIDNPDFRVVGGRRLSAMRYGENPHQSATLHASGEARPGVCSATLVQGKALSYNNINDTDAAYECVAELGAASP
ncbi:MAG: bifunctional phosphoribosylaminoimidazolecarboxamide formyltransferase/IMP cyclohydrolase, partial [Pseudomonadota bacterium]